MDGACHNYLKVFEIDENEKEFQEGNISADYSKKFLLTKNEYKFYKELKSIADELGLTILSKIRMADLVESNEQESFEYQKAFSKIKAKHVDFALADPDNLYIKLLIELDDASHEKEDRIKRDEFVEKVYKEAGYKLLRVKNDTSYLREKIIEELDLDPNDVCVFDARQSIWVKNGSIYRSEKCRSYSLSFNPSVSNEELNWFNKLKIAFNVKRHWGLGIKLKWNK